jgi:FkbM family methyltransferase
MFLIKIKRNAMQRLRRFARRSLSKWIPYLKPSKRQVCLENTTSENVGNEKLCCALSGISLELPRQFLTREISAAIKGRTYEATEFRLISRLVRPTDVVLELGAGIGFVTTEIARCASAGSVHAYEANPALIDVARRTFELNAVQPELTNAIVDGQKSGPACANLHVHESFWASSSLRSGGVSQSVPRCWVGDIVTQLKPDVIVVDIEGGEIDLFDGINLSSIRTLIVEVHKDVIALSGVDRVFQSLRRAGLVYDPDYSTHQVVTFNRAE